MHPFKVSDKVVCIEDRGLDTTISPIHTGTVYVVRGVHFTKRFHGGIPVGTPGVYLVGLRGPIHSNGNEISYRAARFRKLDEIKEENRLKRVHTLTRIPPIFIPSA